MCVIRHTPQYLYLTREMKDLKGSIDRDAHKLSIGDIALIFDSR